MEIIRDLKTNGLFALLKALTLTLTLLLTYNVLSFSNSADEAINRSFSSDAQVNLYSVTDSLTDPDAFYSFRESKTSLDSLARFYNTLNRDTSFEFLSSFDQAIPVAEFKGDETFDTGYGTELAIKGEYYEEQAGVMVRDVKAMQMNQASFDFYNLEVADGGNLDWENLDYTSRSIPILLGNDYHGIYKIGDVLKSNYYSVGMDLVVSGFLAPSSSLFYKGEMNTFLDDHLVIPYPSELKPVSDEDMYFYGILFFAMVSGEVAVDLSINADDVMRHMGSIANQSGFQEYTLLNTPSYLAQYQLMKEIISQNGVLLTSLGVLISTCVILVNGAMSTQLVRRRSHFYKIRWLQGNSRTSISRFNGAVVMFEYLAVALAVSLVAFSLPNWSRSSLSSTLLVLGTVLVADLLYQNFLVSRRLYDRSSTKGETF